MRHTVSRFYALKSTKFTYDVMILKRVESKKLTSQQAKIKHEYMWHVTMHQPVCDMISMFRYVFTPYLKYKYYVYFLELDLEYIFIFRKHSNSIILLIHTVCCMIFFLLKNMFCNSQIYFSWWNKILLNVMSIIKRKKSAYFIKLFYEPLIRAFFW